MDAASHAPSLACSLVARLVWVAALAAAPLAAGCGTSCEEIRQDRAAFELRMPGRHTADARVIVPFPILDRAIAEHLAQRETVAIRLPVEKLGLKLDLSARLDAITTRAERPGKLGLSADIGLYEGAERIADAHIDTAATPVYHPGQSADDPGVLVLSLRSDDLGKLRPRMTPAARDRLAAWLRGELPPLLRGLADKDLVGAAADELLAYFGNDVWPDVKGKILGPDHELFTTQLALPRLPVAQVTTRSREATAAAPGAMIIDLGTTLPVAVDLPVDDPPVQPGLVTFRLTGETAAELINVGMARGELPGRFDAAGKPKPDGRWEARLGWQRGDRPLVAHLWQTVGSCKSARVSGALKVAVRGDKLGLEVKDGRVDSVRGPAMTEAFAWLDALWSDAIELVFEVASFTRAELDGRALDLRVRDVHVDARALTVDLDAHSAR
ncbi:MAG: hypothetical protein U1F43_20815 [Myxococcota bacterium]